MQLGFLQNPDVDPDAIKQVCPVRHWEVAVQTLLHCGTGDGLGDGDFVGVGLGVAVFVGGFVGPFGGDVGPQYGELTSTVQYLPFLPTHSFLPPPCPPSQTKFEPHSARSAAVQQTGAPKSPILQIVLVFTLQLPFTQLYPASQTLSGVPQLRGSVCVSKQVEGEQFPAKQ